uniref:Uncharacterized protein n=1 Tax=Steinernema glaseri TaxID=37863 RepID=A0A1I7Z204_9BILA
MFIGRASSVQGPGTKCSGCPCNHFVSPFAICMPCPYVPFTCGAGAQEAQKSGFIAKITDSDEMKHKECLLRTRWHKVLELCVYIKKDYRMLDHGSNPPWRS